MSLDELKKIQKEFNVIDKDRSGTITREEVIVLLDSDLPFAKDMDPEMIIEICDANGDGVIDFQEFMSVCIDKKVLRNEDDLKTAYQILDYNGDGHVTLEDFEGLFQGNNGSGFDRDLWDQLLAEADVNGDGTINFEEFKNAMSKTLQNMLDDGSVLS